MKCQGYVKGHLETLCFMVCPQESADVLCFAEQTVPLIQSLRLTFFYQERCSPYLKILEAQAENLGATFISTCNTNFNFLSLEIVFFSRVASSHVNCYGFEFFYGLKTEKVFESVCQEKRKVFCQADR